MSHETLPNELAQLGVATVYEASGRQGLIDVPLLPVLPGKRAAGPALTVACGQDDNLAVHACIEHIQPGSIVVITMPESRPVGLIGELLVVQMKVRGAAGVLIDAAVRDRQELEELGLPIWTRFLRVRGATKEGPIAIGSAVTIGGARINGGDTIVLDDDGAVVVGAADVQRVLEAARQRAQRERAMRERLERGEMSFDIHGLRKKVGDPR
ncbi:MAG TPA: 4-carboxy-4-hydroxy-2-oxoadipate aldolase/oxaloacetate decarboxylase [Trueperaceae bacterium]